MGDSDTLELISNESSNIDRSVAIAAGKFRRYHGVPWQKQALDIPMQLLNLRDGLFFLIGLVQSFFMLLLRRPDVVFVKGGYVGLPVGLSASWLGIPLVIHESDAHMGLTNKTLSTRAVAIGVGMPEENYQLGNTEVSFVGVPVSSAYRFVDSKLMNKYKSQLGVEPETKVVVITGGSHGAERINNIVGQVSGDLVKQARVFHQTGQETYESTKEAVEDALSVDEQDKYTLLPFIEKDMHVYLGAADVVVTRVGTTTMAELAIAAKPLVLIPNPKLVYGHQLKNAEVYKGAGAAVVVDESQALKDSNILLAAVTSLLASSAQREKLSTNLHKLAKPNAAKDIAKLILKQA